MALIPNLHLLGRIATKTLLIRSPIDQLNYELFAKSNYLMKTADGIKKPCIPINKHDVSKEDCGFTKKIKTFPPSCGVSKGETKEKRDNRSCEEILKEKEKKKQDNRSCEEILKEKEKKKTDNRSCEEVPQKNENKKNKKPSDCLEIRKDSELPDKSKEEMCEDIFKKENVKKDGKTIKEPAGVPGCHCSFVSASSFLIPTFHNKHGFYRN